MEQIETKRVEEKLPELELEILTTSPETLNKEKLKVLFPWGDFSFLTTDESIAFYDEKLKKVFEESLKISTNWSGIGKNSYNIAHADGEIRIDNTRNSNIRNEFHKEAFKKIGEEFKIENPGSDWINVRFLNKEKSLGQDNGDVQSFGDNRYIIIKDKDCLSFKVYDTQDDRGITTSPNNWRKYDSNTPIDKVPLEIQNHLVNLIRVPESLKELNNKYSAIITDLSISILPKDNLQGQKIFSEELSGIGDNVIVDPTNENIIYFSQQGSPKDIVRVDMGSEPGTWKTEYAELPKKYPQIKNLRLDPTGAFFLFYTNDDLVMITKDTLEEVKKMPGVSNVSFDSQGRIRGINAEGHLTLYDVDYDSLGTALAKRKAQNLTTNVDIENIFSQKNKNEKSYDEATIENLEPIKKDWENQILPKIGLVGDINEVLSLRSNLNDLRKVLRSQNMSPDQIQFVTEGIEKAISEKEKEYATQEAEKYLTDVETKLLSGQISISSINELRTLLDKIKPIEGALDLANRERARKLVEDVNKAAMELFGREGSRIIEDLDNLMKGTKDQLEKLVNKNEFDDWMEFRFPQLKARLGGLLQDCPIEAFEAANAITKARTDLVTIADTFNKKFQLEYAQVREKAVERTDTIVKTLSGDVAGLAERLKSKQFTTREEAEQYLGTSEAKRVLEDEIKELGKNNPEAAKELDRSLKVAIANSYGAIERGGTNLIAETGQQMVLFGSTQFPRFEGKVKEKLEVKTDLTFVLDQQSKGPGINPKDFYGDVDVIVTDNKGVKKTSRLYESLQNEDEWRLGMFTYRGDAVPASYVTAENFKVIKQHMNAWENGSLKEEDKKRREDISAFFATRAKRNNREEVADKEWQETYKQKIKEYGTFCVENHIVFFKRMDHVKKENTIDENGKGYVPKWQNHWVADTTTESYLEQMAKHFKMQGDLQEGILNLQGHAGTGKDVLIKMFASKEKGNRPYFAIDCTKWTTEYELAEDVILEAKNGATQTVRVPSSVLSGIQTPGAMVYFNELNAMPEQAQIFLHALFDEKRAMTLKTSSGKTVEALPSILFACSMNPNYPGTFEPQFATKSRMVSMEIDYPALHRKTKDGEPKGKEEPYNASEALRVARGVESLVDFTYELNMDKNEFVKIWDKHINGINNEALPINKSQEFDLHVIRALIQFADRLRTDFKLNFEKSKDSRNALPVSQPLTLREMRRCAYALSNMPDTEKLSADSDSVARGFIKEFFLNNIYKTDDRKKIEDALRVMNSKNRVL